MVAAVPAVLGVTLETMTAATTGAMTAEATIAMTTEITTDHTENALHRRTTGGSTDPVPGHGLILLVVIE